MSDSNLIAVALSKSSFTAAEPVCEASVQCSGQGSGGGIARPSRQSTLYTVSAAAAPHYQHCISYTVHLPLHTQWRCCLQVTAEGWSTKTCSPEGRGAGLGDIVTLDDPAMLYVASLQLRWTLHWCTGAGAGAGNTQPGDNTSKQEDINRGCDGHIHSDVQVNSISPTHFVTDISLSLSRKLGQRYYKGLCVILYTSKPRL